MKVKIDIKAFNSSQWLQSQVLIEISPTNFSNERAKPREIILNFKLNGWGSGDPSVEPPTVVRQKVLFLWHSVTTNDAGMVSLKSI
jgi:hypothetical protein